MELPCNVFEERASHTNHQSSSKDFVLQVHMVTEIHSGNAADTNTEC